MCGVLQVSQEHSVILYVMKLCKPGVLAVHQAFNLSKSVTYQYFRPCSPRWGPLLNLYASADIQDYRHRNFHCTVTYCSVWILMIESAALSEVVCAVLQLFLGLWTFGRCNTRGFYYCHNFIGHSVLYMMCRALCFVHESLDIWFVMLSEQNSVTISLHNQPKRAPTSRLHSAKCLTSLISEYGNWFRVLCLILYWVLAHVKTRFQVIFVVVEVLSFWNIVFQGPPYFNLMYRVICIVEYISTSILFYVTKCVILYTTLYLQMLQQCISSSFIKFITSSWEWWIFHSIPQI